VISGKGERREGFNGGEIGGRRKGRGGGTG